MNGFKRRTLAIGLLVTLLGLGCNPLTGTFFLLFGVDDKVAPEHRLCKDGKEVKVVVLTSAAPDLRPELLGVERQLSSLVAKRLTEGCAANKEKVTIVPVSKVERFKSDHPGWRAMGAVEIGKFFDADCVIDLEVMAMTLYEPGSRQRLYRGKSKISVALFDVKKAEDDAAFRRDISTEYPGAKGPIPVDDDNNTDKFREMFLNRVATDISWYFTAHISSDNYRFD